MRLPLPLRRRPAIWLGIIGVPLLFLVAATGDSVPPEESWWTMTIASSTMLVTVSGGLSAVATALETARLRRLRGAGSVSARPWPGVLGDALWPGVLVGIVLQLCGIGITAIRDSGPSGVPSAGLILAIGAGLLSFAAFGALCGALLPPVFAVPIALCGSYLWLSFPGSIEWAPLRHLTVSNFYELRSPDLEPDPASLLAVIVCALGVALGCVALALAALPLAARTSVSLVLGSALVLSSMVSALFIARDIGYDGVRQRDVADLVCTSGATAVCLYPEQQGGTVSSEQIQGYTDRLRSAGMVMPTRVSAGSGIDRDHTVGDDSTVFLRYSTAMSPAQVAGSLATALIPPLSETCATEGGYSQALLDVGALSAGWYLHVMLPELSIADVSAEVGAPIERLSALLAAPERTRYDWLDRARAAGLSCVQNPELVP